MGPPPQIGDAYQYDVSFESSSPNDSFSESTNVTARNWLNDAQIQAASDARFAMLFFNDVRVIADSAPESPKVDDVWAATVAVPTVGDITIRLRLSIKVDNVADGRTDVEFSGLTNQPCFWKAKRHPTPSSSAALHHSRTAPSSLPEGNRQKCLGPGAARAGQWTRSWSVAQE